MKLISLWLETPVCKRRMRVYDALHLLDLIHLRKWSLRGEKSSKRSFGKEAHRRWTKVPACFLSVAEEKRRKWAGSASWRISVRAQRKKNSGMLLRASHLQPGERAAGRGQGGSARTHSQDMNYSTLTVRWDHSGEMGVRRKGSLLLLYFPFLFTNWSFYSTHIKTHSIGADWGG